MKKDDSQAERRRGLYADLIHWIESGERSGRLREFEQRSPEEYVSMERLAREMVASLHALGSREWTEERAQAARDVLGSLPTGGVGHPWVRWARRVLEPPAPAWALRSAGGGPRLHLLYELEGFDLDLSLNESRDLVGQILGRDPDQPAFAGGRACLQGASTPPIEAPIEDDGVFFFQNAPGGAGVLILTAAFGEVVVDDLELPQP